MTAAEQKELRLFAVKVREGILRGTHAAKSGHPGGSLSSADYFTYLYKKEIRVDPKNPHDPNRDRFVLSKGHVAPGLYATLANCGFFPVEELLTLRHIGSRLQGHPNMNLTPGIDMSTGSLGQGLSTAAGMAKGAKYLGKDINVYTLLGDGELAEGQIWEATMFAAHYGLDNLCIAVDVNGLQIDGKTADVMNSAPVDKKFEAFGCAVQWIEGQQETDGDSDEDGQGQGCLLYGESGGLAWQSTQRCRACPGTGGLGCGSEEHRGGMSMAEVKKIATRESYGNGLVELGKEHDNVVVLDADLAGATKTAIFKKAFPDRHFNCGIAECNLVDVGAGLSTMGLVPFVSTFAMFAAGRAYEQVRNTIGYPHLNVKICATHGGISVGEDGASHQCCEDFALMRTIPGMTVMCPSDDVEARKMLHAAYEMDGPVYIRFGRAATPVYHAEDFPFVVGKGEVLQDGTDVAVIATGILVPEAIEAGKRLAAEGISTRVINMATIKPLDTEIVLRAARECGKIVTVEEHNIIGGLGEAVCAALAEGCPVPVRRVGVNDVFGHSGPAAELLKEFGLTADHIAETARTLAGK